VPPVGLELLDATIDGCHRVTYGKSTNSVVHSNSFYPYTDIAT